MRGWRGDGEWGGSRGCDGVDGACAERGFLHSKRQLGGRQARILAERHQQRASMAAVAHEADLEGGGRRDGGDDADVGAVVLQVGSLAGARGMSASQWPIGMPMRE